MGFRITSEHSLVLVASILRVIANYLPVKSPQSCHPNLSPEFAFLPFLGTYLNSSSDSTDPCLTPFCCDVEKLVKILITTYTGL